MSRWSFFTDQPSRTNWTASQSSSSGCVGGSERVPKSLGVRTSPSPKWPAQTRLTRTRAVSGLSGLAIVLASSSRPLPSVNGLRVGGDHGRGLARDGRAAIVVVAANEDDGLGRLRRVVEDVRAGRRGRARRLERVDLSPDGRERFAVGAVAEAFRVGDRNVDGPAAHPDLEDLGLVRTRRARRRSRPRSRRPSQRRHPSASSASHRVAPGRSAD